MSAGAIPHHIPQDVRNTQRQGRLRHLPHQPFRLVEDLTVAVFDAIDEIKFRPFFLGLTEDHFTAHNALIGLGGLEQADDVRAERERQDRIKITFDAKRTAEPDQIMQPDQNPEVAEFDTTPRDHTPAGP